MANLPRELVDDILSRLPVKELLRFRCVSKAWLDLIDSPDFVKIHLNRSSETKNNRSLLVIEPLRTYLSDVDSLDVTIQETDHPLKNSHKTMPDIGGSCNGLVLLIYRGNSRYDDGDDAVLIWNLFTRNYRILPFAEFNFNADDYIPYDIRYGMGYDSVHDDYKVVRMIQFGRKNDYKGSEVKVYSLKSNTWRRIQDLPYYYSFRINMRHGVFSGGALHWLVSEKYDGDDPYIAAFDLATEEYRSVPVPPSIENFGECGVASFAVLEGCLCIRRIKTRRLDVWVMKQYGVVESWTKLLSYDLLPQDMSPYLSNQLITPLTLSKDGTQLLLIHYYRKLIWIDIEGNVRKINYFKGSLEAEAVMKADLMFRRMHRRRGEQEAELMLRRTHDRGGVQEAEHMFRRMHHRGREQEAEPMLTRMHHEGGE